MTPDQELIELLRELNAKLGQLDAEMMHVKNHMQSLESALGDLTQAIKKK
jgi:prefoldin subunit 5